jgi:hypothetical protein
MELDNGLCRSSIESRLTSNFLSEPTDTRLHLCMSLNPWLMLLTHHAPRWLNAPILYTCNTRLKMLKYSHLVIYVTWPNNEFCLNRNVANLLLERLQVNALLWSNNWFMTKHCTLKPLHHSIWQLHVYEQYQTIRKRWCWLIHSNC